MANAPTADLGQRRLAAIVFTDVVGFSARMQQNEADTLRLVARDSELIKATCETFNGRILKSTGDGLLIFFDSAVDAVAAALRIQESLNQHKLNAPTHDALEHRIGIHLGDVFIRDGDVMGDGVNIAARLQAEAQPGGICISQTVYDVVKNKLSLQAIALGARELKNIREAVPAYQILLDAQQVLNAPSGPRDASSSKNTGLAVAAVVLVAVLAGVGYWKFRPHDGASEAAIPAQRPSASRIPATAMEAPPPLTVTSEAPPVETPPSPPVRTTEPLTAENTPPPSPRPNLPAPPTFALQRAIPWIQQHLPRYTRSNPLTVLPPPRLIDAATNMPASIAWLESNVLHFQVGDKDTASPLMQAQPIVIEYVLYSLTQTMEANTVPEPIRRMFAMGPPSQGSAEGFGQGVPMPPEGGLRAGAVSGQRPAPPGDRRPPQGTP